MAYTEATTTESGGVLQWVSNGYYITGDEEWKDITVTATIKYNGGSIGLIPRFSKEDVYLAVVLQNTADTTQPTSTAVFDVQLFDQTIHLDSKEGLPALVAGTSYELKAEITKSNYKIYLGTTLLFNIQYGVISKGQVGVYATIGNECDAIEVQTPFPDTWVTNAATIDGAIINIRETENKDAYFYFYNPVAGTELYAEQEVDVLPSTKYSFSYDYEGGVKARVIETNGGAATFEFAGTEPVINGRRAVSFTTSAGCTKVRTRLYVDTDTVSMADEIQLERKDFATDYIDNPSTTTAAVRNSSYITFPGKNNIDPLNGSVNFFIKPSMNYSRTLGLKPIFFEYGEDSFIRVFYDGAFTLGYGDSAVTTSDVLLSKDTMYQVTARWSENAISIGFDTIMVSISDTYDFNGSSNVIRIGHSNDDSFTVFYGAIDDLIVYSKVITQETINDIFASLEPVPTTDDILLRATFNYAIANFDTSTIEMTPRPELGSPVIVEKNDGTPLRKVSFFDKYTGMYQTYNEQMFQYDGVSAYLTMAYKDIDTEGFKAVVRDVNGVVYGEPYRIEGSRIYMTLSEAEKKSLKGKALYAMYQPKDAYTVDYNIGVPDSFRVNVGKYDGKGLNVKYEGNRFSEEKLATMIEMNPLLNANHEGFLYITQNLQEVATFRVKTSQTDLPADGVTETLITIEPLDSNGNFISSAKLDIRAEKGKAFPNFDPGSIQLRERAGQYLYRYRAPLLSLDQEKVPEITDYVNIQDRDTGLGVQIPITLALSSAYSSSEYFLTPDEEEMEAMAVFILGRVTDNWGADPKTLPDGLGDILDLNNDDKIDIEEIVWLRDHMFTKELVDKHAELRNWDVLYGS